MSLPIGVDEVLSVVSLADLYIAEEACRPLCGESCIYHRARVTTLRVKRDYSSRTEVRSWAVIQPCSICRAYLSRWERPYQRRLGALWDLHPKECYRHTHLCARAPARVISGPALGRQWVSLGCCPSSQHPRHALHSHSASVREPRSLSRPLVRGPPHPTGWRWAGCYLVRGESSFNFITKLNGLKKLRRGGRGGQRLLSERSISK